MDDDVLTFGTALGRKALAREWAAVQAMLAPWLRAKWSAADVQRFFEDEYRATLGANGAEGMHYPERPEPELGGNAFTKATQLREPISFAGAKVRDVCPEVTDETIRYWMMLQLQSSEEQEEALGFDSFCQVWMAVVDTAEGLRVGYWSQGAY